MSQLRVAIIGDSVMWGQGLTHEQRFAVKGGKAIARMLGRNYDEVVFFAHSGAEISFDEDETQHPRGLDLPSGIQVQALQGDRLDFFETYPELFKTEEDLIDFFTPEKSGSRQDVAANQKFGPKGATWGGEYPRTFPTVTYQLNHMLTDAVGQTIDVLFLNGGANDLAFQTIVNPTEFTWNFAETFDPVIERVCYHEVKNLLAQARAKCPNAVIIFTGYYAPFHPKVSNDGIEAFYRYLSGFPGWLISLAQFVAGASPTKSLPVLTWLGQIRAQYAMGRGLYYLRKVVTEAYADPQLRGSGILFVHPAFGPKNTMFEAESFIHNRYRFDITRGHDDLIDPAKGGRHAAIPRFELASKYVLTRELLFSTEKALSLPDSDRDPSTIPSRESVIASAQHIIQQLPHNLPLKGVLTQVVRHPHDPSHLRVAVKSLDQEIARINHAGVASLIHPNAQGAARYAEVIERRFDRYQRNITLRDDLKRLLPKAKRLSLRQAMKRYGFMMPMRLRAFMQHMNVDSIKIEINTHPSSDRRMRSSVVADFVGVRSELNVVKKFTKAVLIPFGLTVVDSLDVEVPVSDIWLRIHPYFEPGRRDVFMIDAGGRHLSALRNFKIVRRPPQGGHEGADNWKITRVAVELNGIPVFTWNGEKTLGIRDSITFDYPG